MSRLEHRRPGRGPRIIAARKDTEERLLLLSPAGAGDPVVLTLCDAEGNLHLLQPDEIRIESIGRKSPAAHLDPGPSGEHDSSVASDPQYERFTDRARKIMRIAKDICTERGASHLSSDHILVGLIDEGSNVGTIVLRDRLYIDLAALRSAALAPETPRADATKVIEASLDVARHAAFNYVGSEVLLIALASTEGFRSAEVLAEAGVDATQLKAEILDYLGQS